MSWNLFSKQTVPKQKAISAVIESDYEREVKKFKHLEESSKKLYNDLRKYNESLQALNTCEERLVKTMKGAPLALSSDNRFKNLQDMINNYKSVQYRTTAATEAMVSVSQKVGMEPIKVLYSVYPQVHGFMRRREQCVQDVNKFQGKVDKYKDKERTPQNLMKLAEGKKSLGEAMAQFHTENSLLMTELPALCNQTAPYFQPSLSSITSAQICFYNELNTCYESICNRPSTLSIFSDNNQREQDLYQTKKQLEEIKSLSIVDDD